MTWHSNVDYKKHCFKKYESSSNFCNKPHDVIKSHVCDSIPFPAPRDRLQTFFGLLRSGVSHSFSSLSLCDFPLLALSSPITINVTIRLIFILKTRRASVSCYGFKGRRNTHILHRVRYWRNSPHRRCTGGAPVKKISPVKFGVYLETLRDS